MGSVGFGRYGNRYRDCDELGGLRTIGGKFARAIDRKIWDSVCCVCFVVEGRSEEKLPAELKV